MSFFSGLAGGTSAQDPGHSGGDSGASIFSSVAANLGDKIFSKKEAAKSRNWSERQYNRRYSTAVSDLRAAGLNPILAASGGLGGGSGPSGATAQSSNSRDVGEAINARNITKAQIENLKSQTGKNNQDTITSESQAMQNTANAINLASQTNKNTKETELMAERINTEKALQKQYQSNSKLLDNKSTMTAPLSNLIDGANIPSSAKQAGEYLKAAPSAAKRVFDAPWGAQFDRLLDNLKSKFTTNRNRRGD